MLRPVRSGKQPHCPYNREQRDANKELWGDGHASWVNARALISMSENGELEGTGWICPGTSAEAYQASAGLHLRG